LDFKVSFEMTKNIATQSPSPELKKDELLNFYKIITLVIPVKKKFIFKIIIQYILLDKNNYTVYLIIPIVILLSNGNDYGYNK
jgi:hypothetical protein